MDKLQFLLIVTVFFIVKPAPLLICPVNWYHAEILKSYYHDYYCNKNLSCSTVSTAFPGRSLIVIHNGEWQETKPIVTQLSSCGVKTVPIHVKENIPKHVCSYRNRVILSITKFETEFFEKKFALKTCTLDNYTGSNEDAFHHILNACPTIIWLFGNSKCETNLSSTFALTVTRILSPKKVLTVGVLKSTPFVDKQITEFNEIVYSGLIIELLSVIGETYNLKFKFVEPEDQKYGSPYNGTSWNGFIGIIQKKEVDLVAADLTITYPRQQVVDFSFPFYHPSYGILIRLPLQQEQKMWTIIYLFQPFIWLTLLLSLIIASNYILLLHKIIEDDNQNGFNTLSKSIWYMFSGLVNQGGALIPKSFTTKTFLTFWWIYVLLIANIYSGCLIAIVTRSIVTLPFKNMAGLVEAVSRNSYKVCINNNTSYQTALFNNNGVESKTLKRFFQQNPSYLSNDSGCIEKLFTEPNVALISQTYYLESVQNEYCLEQKLILLNDFFNGTSFGLAFPKNSTLIELFSSEIFTILDAGMIPAWKLKYSDKRKFCNIINPDDAISVENRPLQISEISGAFILLLIGIVFSFIYFFVEKHYWKKIKIA